jgi:hypothetical protein
MKDTLKRLFQNYDSKEKGYLTHSEARSLIIDIYMHNQQFIEKRLVNFLIESMDLNGDGKSTSWSLKPQY